MITVSLDSPTTLSPGSQVLEFTVTSDNESDGFPENIRFQINNIPVTHSIDGDSALIEVELLGLQTAEVRFSGTDEDGLTEAVFSIAISSSVLYRDYDRTVWGAYGHELLGYFPDYSKARGDLNSVTRQLLNPLALELDKTKLSIHKTNKSLNFREAEVSDLDWLYEHQLGLGERFQTTQDALGDTYPITPSIYGYRGVNRLRSQPKGSATELAEGIPDRLVAEDRGTSHTQLSASMPFRELGNLNALKLSSPGWLYYEIHSVVGSLDIEGQVRVFKLILTGEGPGRILQTEKIKAAFPGFYRTTKRWSKINKVHGTGGVDDIQGEVVFYEAPPRNRVQADLQIRKSNGRTIYWQLDKDTGGSYVDQISRSETLVLDTIKEQDTSEVVSRHRLRDVVSEDIFINDISIDQKSFKMAGLGSDRIYLWERREEFPERLHLLNLNSETPEQTFFLSLYDFPYDDSGDIKSIIRIELDAPASAREVSAWRWSLHDPEGLSRYLDEEKAITDDGPNWLYNETPINRYGIREQDFSLEVNGVGTWTLTLSLLFANGTEESYSKSINIIGNNALAEILLPVMEGYVEDDASIEILPNGNYLVASQGKSWILRKQFDSCVIDYDSSSILFKEEFDKVEVILDEQ